MMYGNGERGNSIEYKPEPPKKPKKTDWVGLIDLGCWVIVLVTIVFLVIQIWVYFN